MAVVYPKGTELGDNFAPLDVEPLGILTLEDVMEELINEEPFGFDLKTLLQF